MAHTTLYDLIQPGMSVSLGSHTFEADEIINFARRFDPQPFHLSEELAKGALFGKLCASGWHTGSIYMKLNVAHSLDEILRLTEYQGPKPVFGPSPGLRNIGWHHPVFVGDTISYKKTVTGKRESHNRKGWGMVMEHVEGHNQNGKIVISLDAAVTLKME